MAHTPGPWRWDLMEHDGSWPGVWLAHIHEPLKFGVDGEEGIYLDNPDDARLIAAAPDLLEALERISDIHVDITGCVATSIARAAIQKATS